MYTSALESEIRTLKCSRLICAPILKNERVEKFTKREKVLVGETTAPFYGTMQHYQEKDVPYQIMVNDGYSCKRCDRHLGLTVPKTPTVSVNTSGPQKTISITDSTPFDYYQVKYLCNKPELNTNLQRLWEKAGLTDARDVPFASGLGSLWTAAMSEDNPVRTEHKPALAHNYEPPLYLQRLTDELSLSIDPNLGSIEVDPETGFTWYKEPSAELSLDSKKTLPLNSPKIVVERNLYSCCDCSGCSIL